MHSVGLSSDPQGDDLMVEGLKCVTHDFELSADLRQKADDARKKVISEGAYGLTRTNPDGITIKLQIREGKLWVTDITISGGDGSYATNPTEIPTNIVSRPILADWFTGDLTAYYGRHLLYHMREGGYIFKINKGRITEKRQASFKIK